VTDSSVLSRAKGCKRRLADARLRLQKNVSDQRFSKQPKLQHRGRLAETTVRYGVNLYRLRLKIELGARSQAEEM